MAVRNAFFSWSIVGQHWLNTLVRIGGTSMAMPNKSRHNHSFSTVENYSSWGKMMSIVFLPGIFCFVFATWCCEIWIWCSLRLEKNRLKSMQSVFSSLILLTGLNSTHCTTLGLHSLLNVVQLLDLVTKKICHIHGSQSVWMWVNCIHRSTRRVHQNTSTVRLDWADL